MRRFPLPAALLTTGLLLGGCGATSTAASDDAPTSASDTGASAEPSGTLRLGYFPNVTHAPAIVGLGEGLFEQALGDGVTLETRTFNAGGEAIEALLSGAIDATYIGPNPAINGFARSNGEALRIVAGTTSGGAYLVTRPELTDPAQLAGTTLSTPALGNTQDVALRAWLAEEGFETTPEGGGEVAIQPQENAQILETFLDGQIDGAWVPEPWATRMIEEGGGRVLVDERDLWPDTDGEYVTTHLVVATSFLEEQPEIVAALLQGHLDAIERTTADPTATAGVVADGIAAVTGVSPDTGVVEQALGNLTFTPDPIADSLRGSADAAIAVGLLEPVDLDGIYDLTTLNRLLTQRGDEEVSE
ncbi:ABC transporter substrate-binding protein [Egicoccus sp. AB-alg2]|uniref:ABC transporter substrate-binding protein n=1 Tax=Egicoccus sp. AB-alg2 TaxID=3242693 RepID=UPI00359E07D0